MKWLNGFLLASILVSGSSGKRPTASDAGKGIRMLVSHYENVLGTSSTSGKPVKIAPELFEVLGLFAITGVRIADADYFEKMKN